MHHRAHAFLALRAGSPSQAGRAGEPDKAAQQLAAAHRYFFSTFHSASSGTESRPEMLLRIAVGGVNWPSGTKVG